MKVVKAKTKKHIISITICFVYLKTQNKILNVK